MATPSFGRIGANFPSGDEAKICTYLTVNPDDIIVTKWPLVKPKVLEIIKKLPWAVLSVVRGEYQAPLARFLAGEPETSVGDHPIVLVGAPSESQASWHDIAERVYSLCREYDLGHARVLFESVRYPLTATDPLRNLMVHFRGAVELVENERMGLGFGPTQGTPTSASMGGTIKLQGENEEPTALLMSVFHPFRYLVNPGQVRSGWRHYLAQPITMKMPSPEAVQLWKIKLEGIIRDLKSDINKLRLSPNQIYQNGAERCQRTLEDEEASLRALEDTISDDSSLGFLQYGSGFSNGFDWSLSSFKHRTINNISPKWGQVEDALRDSGRLNDEDAKAALRWYVVDKEVKIGRPEAGALAMKRGQTTGLTVGKINALPSNLVIREGLELKEEVVFEVRAVLGEERGYNIVDGGDSGAWFLNMDGEWIGGLVASHGAYGTIALVLDAEEIVKDIEDFTGKKVVYPTRSSTVL